MQRLRSGEGNRAIAAIAKKMSQQYDSVRNNSTIQSFIASQNTTEPIKFSNQDIPRILSTPPNARAVITLLGPYVEHGPLGGTYGILTKNFSLSSDKAFDIISKSDSIEEALMRGISAMPQSAQDAALIRLVGEAKSHYPGFDKTDGYKAFLAAAATIINGEDKDIVECVCSNGHSYGMMPRSRCNVGARCQ